MFWKLSEIGWSKDMKEAARRERAAIWWEKLNDEEKRKYLERKAIKRKEEREKEMEKQAKKDIKNLKRKGVIEVKPEVVSLEELREKVEEGMIVLGELETKCQAPWDDPEFDGWEE